MLIDADADADISRSAPTSLRRPFFGLSTTTIKPDALHPSPVVLGIERLRECNIEKTTDSLSQ